MDVMENLEILWELNTPYLMKLETGSVLHPRAAVLY